MSSLLRLRENFYISGFWNSTLVTICFYIGDFVLQNQSMITSHGRSVLLCSAASFPPISLACRRKHNWTLSSTLSDILHNFKESSCPCPE